MSNQDILRRIDEIGADSGRTLIDRLEEALALLTRECNDHSLDITILQLYTLLAEEYVDSGNYRQLEDVAKGVLSLMRDGMTPADVYLETIPALSSAIGKSVYNHSLYEILLRFIKTVLSEYPGDKAVDASVKPLATKLLKLHLLLDYDEWCQLEWTKEFQESVSQLFTSEELIKIIANPKIGHLNRDPVEYTRKWEKIYYDMVEALEDRFQNAPEQEGLCWHIWNAKREFLKDKYDIDWRSPAEMNPHSLLTRHLQSHPAPTALIK